MNRKQLDALKKKIKDGNSLSADFHVLAEFIASLPEDQLNNIPIEEVKTVLIKHGYMEG